MTERLIPVWPTWCARGVLLLCSVVASAVAPARATWNLSLAGESGRPGGYVKVRENAYPGTPLHFAGDLGVKHLRTIALDAWTALSPRSQLHLSLASDTLDGATTLNRPILFNGTRILPGSLATVTHFPNFLRFSAAYRHSLFDLGDGGHLWVSIGFTFVSLNFKLHGQIAADSPGHETKEDFNHQELPVPIIGLHLAYPLYPRLSLIADVSGGHLPWLDSLRREGGVVRITQTNQDADFGLDYRFAARWQLALYAFSRDFAQHERSREDSNFIRLTDHGYDIRIT